MATVTLTGTADQLRRLGRIIASAADSAQNPRNVTVTIDNGISNAVAGVTGPDGKRKDA